VPGAGTVDVTGVRAGVPLEGVEELKLLMGDGGDHIDNDHGDWADAQVACDP
jgi:NPCBM/NEW2 domain